MRSALLLLLVLTAITVIHCTEEHSVKTVVGSIGDFGHGHLLPITSLKKDNMNYFPPIDGAQFGKNGTWFFEALYVKGAKCMLGEGCIVGEPKIYPSLFWMREYWAKAGAVRNHLVCRIFSKQ